jgi:chemotaxis response regulator CheB
LIAVGASAGGPAALAKVLAPLPVNFPAAIIVVQHVDVQFASGLADWLGYQARLPVRLAKEGDYPQPGTVLLAGTDNHLIFAGPARLGYTRQPVDCSYRPSVDVFFKSVSRFWHGDVVGVLLTGMGRDGAEGLKLLHNQGYRTIVQDQASSAVYGMPKAAAELQAASEILPLDRIGSRLVDLMAQKVKS